jgi:glycine oxidase
VRGSTDVAIVGGGVIGCAIAYALVQAGATVTVYERASAGAEASGAAAGIMVPTIHADEPVLLALGLASVERYPAWCASIQQDSGMDPELIRSGALELAHDEGEGQLLRAKVEAQRRSGRDLRWLSPDDALAVEPGVNPRISGALYDPEGLHVHPLRLTRALAEAASRRGVVIRTGVEVIGLEVNGSRVVGVRTAEGTQPTGHVVIASGAWSQHAEEWLGLSIPVFPVKGQILAVSEEPNPLGTILWDANAYLVARRDGSVVVGATVEQVGFDKRLTVDGIGGLLNAIPSLCPGLAHARFERAWAGLRPATPDELPIVGSAPGWENVIIASGHYRNGITLAPITAEMVRQLVVEEHEDPLLAPLSPARFGS